MSEVRSVLVRITGRVQGVWFRDWTRRKAVSRGLSGWVRNRLDDSVEARFVGPSDLVAQMIDRCACGSPLSRVDEVIVLENELSDGRDDVQQGFEIRKTV